MGSETSKGLIGWVSLFEVVRYSIHYALYILGCHANPHGRLWKFKIIPCWCWSHVVEPDSGIHNVVSVRRSLLTVLIASLAHFPVEWLCVGERPNRQCGLRIIHFNHYLTRMGSFSASLMARCGHAQRRLCMLQAQFRMQFAVHTCAHRHVGANVCVGSTLGSSLEKPALEPWRMCCCCWSSFFFPWHAKTSVCRSQLVWPPHPMHKRCSGC